VKETKNQIFLIIEYLEGGSLEEAIKNGK